MSTQKQPISIKDLMRLLAIIGVAIIFILSIGAFLTFKTLTLVSWWIPGVGSFILASVSGVTFWRIWKKLTNSSNFIINYLLNLIFFTFFFSGLFYTLNALFIRDDMPRKVTVVVEEKYRERHHTSRRVGRRSYVSGPDYYKYFISVTIPEDYHRNIELPASVYKNIRKDSTLTLSLQRGLFGLEVIQTSEILKDNPSPPKNKRRCKFFGTSGRR